MSPKNKNQIGVTISCTYFLSYIYSHPCHNKATGILVFLASFTQPWYPQTLRLSGHVPLEISPNMANLILPQDKAAVHPLAENLTLHIIKLNAMRD